MLKTIGNWTKSVFLNRVNLNFIKTLVVFLIFFFFYRLILLIINLQQFNGVPFFTIVQSFLVGLRFDIAVSLYPLSLFFLINYFFYFFNKEDTIRIFNISYLAIVFFAFIFLSFVEIEYYRYFHSRLNIYFFNFEKNPSFVAKMVWESYPVIPYLIGIAVISSFGFAIFKRIYSKKGNKGKLGILWKLFSFAIWGIFVFIGIRGTLSQKTPLRWGHAFYCQYNCCNKLALNGVFTLFDELLKHPVKMDDIDNLLKVDKDSATKTLSLLIFDSSSKPDNFPVRIYNYNNSGSPKKLNIVIFLLESFSMHQINEYRNKGIPLFFDKLEKESISFENFYSNGIHTYMGVFSSLFGLPNLLGKSVMVLNIGQQTFSGITNLLKEQGYIEYFGTSHDANFDNMAGFLRGNGLDEVISQFDFPQNLVLSTLGVPDHILFEKMNHKFAQSRQPFLGIILSTNNHGPWIIPNVEGKTFHSTFDYTDWAIEHFFELAQKKEYFNNTIFVITADHGLPETPIYDLDLQGTHIPCIIYAPKLLEPQKIATIGSHIDLTNTILTILKIPFQTTNFGRDLLSLDNTKTGFAVFHEGQTLGLIYNDWYLIDRLNANPSLYKYNSNNPLKNYLEIFPDTTNLLKNIVRTYYYVGNMMILSKKSSVQNY